MSLLVQDDPVTLRPPASQSRNDRRFYTGIAVFSALTIFAGFAPTYYLRAATDRAPLPLLLKVHGLVFTSWMVLFIVQTALIGFRRPAIHRKLGYAGAILALLMIPLGYHTAIEAARRWNLPTPALPDALAFLAIPLGDLVVFAPFVALAIWFRRRPEVHKRLMLLATVGGILPVAYSRMSYLASEWVILPIAILTLAAGAIYDRIAYGRFHPVSLWGSLLALASVPGRFALAQTDAWHRFAQWLIS